MRNIFPRLWLPLSSQTEADMFAHQAQHIRVPRGCVGQKAAENRMCGAWVVGAIHELLTALMFSCAVLFYPGCLVASCIWALLSVAISCSGVGRPGSPRAAPAFTPCWPIPRSSAQQERAVGSPCAMKVVNRALRPLLCSSFSSVLKASKRPQASPLMRLNVQPRGRVGSIRSRCWQSACSAHQGHDGVW